MLSFRLKKQTSKNVADTTFNYCSIIWLFCRKTSYKKIEQIQERVLRIVYNGASHMAGRATNSGPRH